MKYFKSKEKHNKLPVINSTNCQIHCNVFSSNFYEYFHIHQLQSSFSIHSNKENMSPYSTNLLWIPIPCCINIILCGYTKLTFLYYITDRLFDFFPSKKYYYSMSLSISVLYTELKTIYLRCPELELPRQDVQHSFSFWIAIYSWNILCQCTVPIADTEVPASLNLHHH